MRKTTGSTEISKSDLQPGDILMWDGSGNEGHVVLFQKWEDKAAGTFWLYEQTSTADDSDVTVGTKFDGFGLHPQLQIGTITQREAVCWLGGDMNAAASGLRGCYFTMPSKSGEWSLDGWVNWDENNDGEPPFGPKYTYGSPIINR